MADHVRTTPLRLRPNEHRTILFAGDLLMALASMFLALYTWSQYNLYMYDVIYKQYIDEGVGPAATDGNHGRGIAWAAEQLHQQAVIYMPKGAARSRVENIRSHGATVIVTDLIYDDAVRLCCRQAEENGWYVIQDTAWEGYTEIPLWIMQGYMTMCVEALDQMALTGLHPTHVFVQVGVGALAGAVVGCLLNKFSDSPPRFITMEPNNAACIFASATAADGRPHAVTGNLSTIMAGLACGEPNPVAWEILPTSVPVM